MRLGLRSRKPYSLFAIFALAIWQAVWFAKLTVLPIESLIFRGPASVYFPYGTQILLDSRLLAEKIANEARNHPEVVAAIHIQGINRLLGILSSPRLFQTKEANEPDWAYCAKLGREKTLAYVSSDQSIHLCQRALTLSIEDLAQVLIHEASHLAFDRRHDYDYEHELADEVVLGKPELFGQSKSDSKPNILRSANLQFNECRATKWEIGILKLSGRTPFGNKYVALCNLEWWGPFRKPKILGTANLGPSNLGPSIVSGVSGKTSVQDGSATTSRTSGKTSQTLVSIPSLRVKEAEGHPEQAPRI